jgi:hypothetical protein
MEAVQENSAIRVFRSERDRPIDDTMVRVRVRCKTSAHALPNGYMFAEPGEAELTVYTHQLKALRDQVEDIDSDRIRLIKDRHEKMLADFVAEGGKAEQYPGSYEAAFREIMFRDRRPLSSVEVIEENIPAPKNRTAIAASNAMATALAEALGPAIANALKDTRRGKA